MTKTSNDGLHIRDLGDGLILRRACPDDIVSVSAFDARIHGEGGWEENQPNKGVGAWVRDLMSPEHPACAPSLFTVVEDSAKKEIVSSLNLIPQIWRYEDVEFGVGRVEAVGTRPDYRGKGLIRAQMDAVHAWSAERGTPCAGHHRHSLFLSPVRL